MKALLVLAALVSVIGCSKEKKPDVPPIDKPPVVDPTPVPVAPDAEFCKAEGKKYHCGTNQWWNLDCGGDIKEEQVYFESEAAIVEMGKKISIGSCIRVHYKDGTNKMINTWAGFGPCLPCSEL